MPLLIVILGIALLLVLILGFKLNSFVAFIIVSLARGAREGMCRSTRACSSIDEGHRDTLGIISLILGLGAMLGKPGGGQAGAAQRIHIQPGWPLRDGPGSRRVMLTAFIVGCAALLRRRTSSS